VCRLIINADDFGLTNGVNQAIIDAHQEGVVTSTTLMANSKCFDQAIQLAKTVPQLGIGCHVMLVDGEPGLNAGDVGSLLAGRNSSKLRNGFLSLAGSAIRGHINPEQIEAEATAQIRKIQSTGLALTHFDTHKHTHMLPQILSPLLRAAQACGVRALRNPFPPLLRLPATQLLKRPALWARCAQLLALQTLRAQFCRLIEQHQMMTTDGTLGIVVTGNLNQELFEVIVGSIPDGTWEYLCHPGYEDQELRQVRTRLRASRSQELKILTSPESREALKRRGVELISYHDLVAQS